MEKYYVTGKEYITNSEGKDFEVIIDFNKFSGLTNKEVLEDIKWEVITSGLELKLSDMNINANKAILNIKIVTINKL